MIILNEATAKDLIVKSKKDTPSRFQHRLEYLRNWNLKSIELSPTNKSNLVLHFRVKDYDVDLEIINLMREVNKVYQTDNPGRYELLLRAAISTAIYNNNLRVSCSCPDYRYRFAYAATKRKYSYGEGENRPAKITNPKNRGSVCKHLLLLLNRPSLWNRRVITFVRNLKEG